MIHLIRLFSASSFARCCSFIDSSQNPPLKEDGNPNSIQAEDCPIHATRLIFWLVRKFLHEMGHSAKTRSIPCWNLSRFARKSRYLTLKTCSSVPTQFAGEYMPAAVHSQSSHLWKTLWTLGILFICHLFLKQPLLINFVSLPALREGSVCEQSGHARYLLESQQLV